MWLKGLGVPGLERAKSWVRFVVGDFSREGFGVVGEAHLGMSVDWSGGGLARELRDVKRGTEKRLPSEGDSPASGTVRGLRSMQMV